MSIKGFTLLEVMFTLILFICLSLFSINALSLFREKNEKQMIIDELKMAIQYAKFQGINLGHTLYLTPPNAETDWSKGMELKQLNKITGQMELLHQWQWQHRNWSLSWSGANANKILISNNPSHAISNGTFTLTDVKSHQSVKILLNRLGRLKVKTD
ncbi:GspH/FimT family pseudopilin [Legionella shakespearei]|uniref:Tfp type 4 fimbrial pilin related signal peptide protein domain protein n=1 Tax=Legionella shakespearei DSM 23087 TaxID=1122169 RepID=A0A0W0YUI9_9GAMM|nr:GspH/FimT family protein [Legionella shakespearei]KTD60519.1 Tfp type 4 fimbrial pilin related signal peptide protein domain protein [Legionella shakespearei DSM 23087]